MIGAAEYRKIQKLEQEAQRLGFVVAFPDHHYQTGMLTLRARTDNTADGDFEHLPVFWREANLMSGSVEELIAALDGWSKCMVYLTNLRLISSAKVRRKEQDYRNQKLIDRLARAESAENDKKK